MVLTAAPKVLLGLPGLHPKMESEAQARIYGLSCNQQQKLKSDMGLYHSWGTGKRTNLQMAMIPRYVQKKPFTVTFYNSSEGENRFQSGTQMRQ